MTTINTVSIGAFTDLNMDNASTFHNHQANNILHHHQATINNTLSSTQSDIAEIKSILQERQTLLQQLSQTLAEITSKLSSIPSSPQPGSFIHPPSPPLSPASRYAAGSTISSPSSTFPTSSTTPTPSAPTSPLFPYYPTLGSTSAARLQEFPQFNSKNITPSSILLHISSQNTTPLFPISKSDPQIPTATPQKMASLTAGTLLQAIVSHQSSQSQILILQQPPQQHHQFQPPQADSSRLSSPSFVPPTPIDHHGQNSSTEMPSPTPTPSPACFPASNPISPDFESTTPRNHHPSPLPHHHNHQPPKALLDLELTILSAEHLKNIIGRNENLKLHTVASIYPKRRSATKPDELQCDGIYRNVLICIGNLDFITDFHLLNILETDAQTLDLIEQTISLSGLETSTGPTKISFNQLRSLCTTESASYHYGLEFNSGPYPKSPIHTESTDPHIQTLLTQYSSIFNKPSDLPPHRELNHHTILHFNAQPTNFKLYRYPYFENIFPLLQQLLHPKIGQFLELQPDCRTPFIITVGIKNKLRCESKIYVFDPGGKFNVESILRP